MKRGKTLIVKEIDLDKFKLRGKAIITGEWIYCNPFSPFGMDVIPETVGRPTGYYDKNRRMIYEGDVVFCESGKAKGVIKFEKGSFVFEWKFAKPLAFLVLKYTDDVEIVGNIHEVER